jgi:cell pole-organizing protein PopZ
MADDKLQQDPTMEEILQSIKRIIAEDGPEGGASDGHHAVDQPLEEAGIPSVEPEEADEDVLDLTELVDESLAPQDDDSHDILADLDAITKAIESEEPLSISGGEDEEPAGLDDTIVHEEPVELEMVDKQPDDEGAVDNAAFEEMDLSELEAASEEHPAEDGKKDHGDRKMADDARKASEGRGLLSPEAAASVSDAFKEFIETLPHPHEDSVPVHSGMVTRSGTTVEDLLIEVLTPLLKDWFEANVPGMVDRIVRDELRKLIPR